MKMLRLFSVACLALLLSTIFSGCTRVDTGNVGVEKTIGKINPQELPAGLYFTMFKTVDEITTKDTLIYLQNMTPKSSNNVTMQDADIDIYYRINPSKVADLVIKYQGDVTDQTQLGIANGLKEDDARHKDDGAYVVGLTRVTREAREAVYTAVATMDATTMHTRREELTGKIRDNLQSALDKTDPGTFYIVAVNIRALTTDKALESSIIAQAAVDQQIAAKDKQIELAKKEAERLAAEAMGIARYNEIISASLTDRLVRLKEIEAQRAFATSGTHTVLMQQGTGALVNVGK